MKTLLATALLLLTVPAFAKGRIQNEDIKSSAEIRSAVLTTTGNLTSSNQCIASPGSTTGLATGLYVYDTTTPSNIASGTTIIGLPGSCSSGQIKISIAAAGSATGDTLTFGGQDSQLPNDTKVWVTGAGLNETLATAIGNGDIANAGASRSFDIVGIGFGTPTAAASALTITMTQPDGSTAPSGGSPVSVSYRNTSATPGKVLKVSTTSTLTLVIPSTATLGQQSATAEATYVYLQDNGGVNQLCASTTGTFDEGSIQTTTTISGSATSRTTLYCTAGATGPIRLAMRFVSTQTTAGTWASNGSEVSLAPFARGFVSSSNIVPARIEWVVVATNCTSSPCALVSKSDGVTSATRNSQGNYSINFPAGMFSVAPSCSGICSAVGDQSCLVSLSNTTTTAFNFNTFLSGSETVADGHFQVMCVGPR